MSALIGIIVPGLPHPLLKPECNPSWMEIRKAYELKELCTPER